MEREAPPTRSSRRHRAWWAPGIRLHLLALGISLTAVIATGVALRLMVTLEYMTDGRDAYTALLSVHTLVSRIGIVGLLPMAALALIAHRLHPTWRALNTTLEATGALHLVAVIALVTSAVTWDALTPRIALVTAALTALATLSAAVAACPWRSRRSCLTPLTIGVLASTLAWLALSGWAATGILTASLGDDSLDVFERITPILGPAAPLVALPAALGIAARIWSLAGRGVGTRANGHATAVALLAMLIAAVALTPSPDARAFGTYTLTATRHLGFSALLLGGLILVAARPMVRGWEVATLLIPPSVAVAVELALGAEIMPRTRSGGWGLNGLHATATIAWYVGVVAVAWILVRWSRRPRPEVRPPAEHVILRALE